MVVNPVVLLKYQGAWRSDDLASRAQRLLLLGCALACASVAPWSAARAEEQPFASATSPAAASDARLAGDDKKTRFILDLDRLVQFRAFTLSDPYRVVVDLPQVNFRLRDGVGTTGRGLIKAFRYGQMPGGSRMVFDLTGPARIANSTMLAAANSQPPRLVLELEDVDVETFTQNLNAEAPREMRRAVADASIGPSAAADVVTQGATSQTVPGQAISPADRRPVVVIDPGHGGVDNGTQWNGHAEKDLVLAFGLALKDQLEKDGKYRVVMTRTDDVFIPLGDRVRIARSQSAALFISIHADALSKAEGDAQGATIYTLSDEASDAEAERLAEAENRADAIGGVNLTDEPTEVAGILIDLAQRETRTFSNSFARILVSEMKNVTRMHKSPLKSAGFKVLKAPDVPSVLVELGYVSNKGDLQHLASESWRSRTAASMAQAIDAFLAKRLATAAPPELKNQSKRGFEP